MKPIQTNSNIYEETTSPLLKKAVSMVDDLGYQYHNVDHKEVTSPVKDIESIVKDSSKLLPKKGGKFEENPLDMQSLLVTERISE